MDLIIPGVDIRVIRELVPRPLGATGVLGIVGCAEKDLSNKPLQALASFASFKDTFGPASALAMPEVKQAFAAGLNQVVVANVPADAASAASISVPLTVDGQPARLEVEARAPGAWGNQVSIRLTKKPGPAGDEVVEVEVFYPDAETLVEKKAVETFRNLSPMRDAGERYFVNVINSRSEIVRVDLRAVANPNSLVLPTNDLPGATPLLLKGGTDPSSDAIATALARLEAVEAVDMVTASHLYPEAAAMKVWAELLTHVNKMSNQAKPRLAFGQVAPSPAGEAPDTTQAIRMAGRLVSDRLVMTAPYGYMGAVIGMIAGLRYFESPTFKPLAGVTDLSFDFSDPTLAALIQGGLCAVDEIPRKGIACVKGITTDSTQINVTRIADRAVRHVQNIAQDFIGLLNTEAQRLALKQRITEAFTRMEKEGALVPSTDGKSPAFAVSVESAPDDFAAGIVRVATAVRPVRAIDYIYATIKVQAF